MILVIFVTFVVVKGFSNMVFMAETPKLNPVFIAQLQNIPQTMGQLPENILAGINGLFNKKPFTGSFANVKMITPPPNAVFKAISKGVSAAEDPTTGQTLIQVQAGTKYRIVGTVTINGKEYPKIEFVE